MHEATDVQRAGGAERIRGRVEDLRGIERAHVETADDQHAPVVQHGRAGALAADCQFTFDRRERAAERIVDLAVGLGLVVSVSADHEHAAVGECRCRVIDARNRHAGGGRELARCRIIDLRLRSERLHDRPAVAHDARLDAARDQHAAIGYQRCGMGAARHDHIAGRLESGSVCRGQAGQAEHEYGQRATADCERRMEGEEGHE